MQPHERQFYRLAKANTAPISKIPIRMAGSRYGAEKCDDKAELWAYARVCKCDRETLKIEVRHCQLDIPRTRHHNMTAFFDKNGADGVSLVKHIKTKRRT